MILTRSQSLQRACDLYEKHNFEHKTFRAIAAEVGMWPSAVERLATRHEELLIALNLPRDKPLRMGD